MGTPESKEKLLQAASKLFADKGFEGVSVKDIEVAAGVNASLIHYHFKNKEGLYQACLSEFMSHRLDSAQSALLPPKTREEFDARMRGFLESFFEHHLERPDYSRIALRELDYGGVAQAEEVVKAFRPLHNGLRGFFEQAQEVGILDRSLNADLLTSIVYGAIMHFLRAQQLSERFRNISVRHQEYRSQVVETILLILRPNP
jgi:AcrR family transcriptional regulator